MHQVQLNPGRKGEVGRIKLQLASNDGKTADVAERPSPLDFCLEGVSCSGMIP